MQRLIRGVGAASSVSRTGFYTTLVAFLSLPSDDEALSVSAIFEVMEKQLHVRKGASQDKVNLRDSLGFDSKSALKVLLFLYFL